MTNIALLRKTLIFLALIAVILFVVSIVWKPNIDNGDNSVSESSQTGNLPETIEPIVLSVSYDENGFYPNPSEAESGTVIEFTNNGDEVLEIQFVEHEELNMSGIAQGEVSASLPLLDAGMYEYVSLNNPLHSGSVKIK